MLIRCSLKCAVSFSLKLLMRCSVLCLCQVPCLNLVMLSLIQCFKHAVFLSVRSSFLRGRRRSEFQIFNMPSSCAVPSSSAVQTIDMLTKFTRPYLIQISIGKLRLINVCISI